MDWFRKSKEGLVSQQKKEIPDGLWTKCKGCSEVIYSRILEESLWVCPSCNYHFRIDAARIIGLLLDDAKLEEFDTNLSSRDPLNFRDSISPGFSSRANCRPAFLQIAPPANANTARSNEPTCGNNSKTNKLS